MAFSKQAKQLIDIFKSSSTRDCIEFFAKNDYTQNTEIIDLVKKWSKEAYSCRNAEQYAKKMGIEEINLYADHRSVFYAAEFSLGKLTEKTTDLYWRDIEHLYIIGKRHGDEWITRWCSYLKRDCFHNWELLRRFHQEGLCQRPEEDEYYMALMLGGGVANRGRVMAVFLRENPDLLEYDIWKLFEVEGSSEVSMANSHYGTDWNATFKELSDEGAIDRFRLLECSLQALTRDFIQFRAGWYSRFHEYMKPTLEERIQLKNYYLQLCNSTINPTVSFALKSITKLEKAGALSPEDLIDYLPAALNNKTKATVKKSIALLEKQIKKAPESTETILLLICNALCHESPDIQEFTLQVLRKHQAFDNEEIIKELDTYADLLSPAIRAQLPTTSAINKNPSFFDTSELLKRISAIPNKLQKPLGIPELVSSLKTGESPDIKAIDLGGIRPFYLDDREDFDPIHTVDELIDACHLYLGSPGDILLVERIIEAIGRVGGKREKDFTKKTAPLLKQCKKILDRNDYFPSLSMKALLSEVCLVFACWITKESPPPCPADFHLYGLWTQRLWWVADKAAKGESFTLVSTPTKGHFLSSSVLRTRLTKTEASEMDLVFALMRMSPIDDTFDFVLKQKNAKKEVKRVAAIVQSKESVIRGELKFVRKRSREGGTWVSLDIEEKYDKAIGKVLDVLWSRDYGRIAEPFPTLNTVFPSHRELLYLAVAKFQADSYFWVEAGSDRALIYEQINHPNEPFGENALLMLGTGLFSMDKYLRGLAGDLLIETIHDGRLGSLELKSLLIDFCKDGFGICKRVAPLFRDASEASPLHVAVIRDAIVGCIPCIQEMPRDFHCFLEVLRDLLVLSGADVKNKEARDVLSTLKGSGKSAKLAKILLACEETTEKSNFDQQVTVALLELRLKRTEKWNTKNVN